MPNVTQHAIELLALTLVEGHKWPLNLAREASRSFIAMHAKYPDEFPHYQKLPQEQQKELWIFYATGWNQGRLFARLATN